jgi:hypothetical protein
VTKEKRTFFALMTAVEILFTNPCFWVCKKIGAKWHDRSLFCEGKRPKTNKAAFLQTAFL